MLQSSEDGIRKPFLHFEESFIFQGHMCIVTEMLGVDLYSHLREKRFSGLSLPIISTILSQILTACATLSDFGIIHADIKPENILASPSIPLVKLADFGSAFLVGGYSCSYIQSRYYRAPEAIVGTGYTPQIDVWSLGCVAAELFIGRPLFPGTSQFDQLFCICEMLGEVPQSMIERGWNRDKYFRQEPVSGSSKMRWRMMTPGEYRTANPPTPMHCPHSYILNSVAATIDLHATRLLSQNERSNRAKADRRPFIDFLQRLLVIDPLQRLTAKQALCHPFITQRPFTSSWQPPLDSADQAVVNGIVDPTNPFSGVIASIGYTLPPCTSKRSSLRLSSSSRLSSSPLSSPPSPTPSLSTPSSLFHARPARPPLSRHRTPTAYVSIPFVSNSSTSMSDDDLSSSNPKSRND
ncbi:putative Dual specificity protein kinase YAK1 [Blattamonas nauphoetae]|uniref:Dual specificity protein kinase YAK1 n=1 Tax=Blattamonas nauphoetae TaxID=2049346 RepID=A0ABQ9XU18_9EUKA|nr:putative Dual specificity protein kinase YAK1 [Blattamonas nauphoetae]